MNSEREVLPLTIEELSLIVKALNSYYKKHVDKAQSRESKEPPYKGRQIKVRQELAFIQETLQFVTLCYNIRTQKLNLDVAAAGGIPYESKS